MVEITPNLSNLISSYPILSTLAEYVSTLDLFHLALTNHSNHASILGSNPIFDRLKLSCLCDSRGLSTRQTFTGPYRIRYRRQKLRQEPAITHDEPVEVRLYNLKCDEAGALPCVRCGINVCEECRDYPRWPTRSVYSFGRPHLNEPCQSANVMCLCGSCDAEQEREVEGRYLNERCGCNVYTRWICSKCAAAFDREAGQYYSQRTKFDAGWTEPTTKLLHDRQHDRAFWCKCGAAVPDEIDPRCMWCKRRHRPEVEWWHEATELKAAGTPGNPFYDPAYPEWVTDEDDKYPTPYPKLGYDRPGEVPSGQPSVEDNES
ncbi:hypothetical protein CkaCkLH20_09545 [Colletotrichum karsti]|uniref:Uncharacterized protein n=1 Tax=Colletotrichum karsti TaxID=1095194 RepID=A0A9P6HZK3_9PEZI|nr:uncharacterized protein CkaCkLH20_09545 [Colletotrichum karsti]KAF9873035.1 hypothetical protein CkaCkLH20_09545 [Colletotrichum karsti]